MLMFIPDCHKNHKMCDNAVDYCSHALEFVPNYHKTQKMYDKTVGTCSFVFDCSLLMPIAWHPTRVRDWCITKDEEKEETEHLRNSIQEYTRAKHKRLVVLKHCSSFFSFNWK